MTGSPQGLIGVESCKCFGILIEGWGEGVVFFRSGNTYSSYPISSPKCPSSKSPGLFALKSLPKANSKSRNQE